MLFRSANSLFEDFCEFGLGMKLGSDRARMTVAKLMEQGLSCTCCTDEMKALFTQWLENKEDAKVTPRTVSGDPPQKLPLCLDREF